MFEVQQDLRNYNIIMHQAEKYFNANVIADEYNEMWITDSEDIDDGKELLQRHYNEEEEEEEFDEISDLNIFYTDPLQQKQNNSQSVSRSFKNLSSAHSSKQHLHKPISREKSHRRGRKWLDKDINEGFK